MLAVVQSTVWRSTHGQRKSRWQMSNPRTRDEILNDATLTIWQRAQEIHAMKQQQNSQPSPPPKPTTRQKEQFKAIKIKLLENQCELTAIEKRETELRKRLPDAQQKFAELEREVDPDASREKILEFVIDSTRLQSLKNSIQSVPTRRAKIVSEINSALDSLAQHYVELFPVSNGVNWQVGNHYF
jgi:hypothetical protein